jgi:hypothetical protein
VKLGTENKRKTIIAGVLVVFAAALLVHNFMGGGQDAAAPATSAAAPAQHGPQPGRKAPRPLLAHSLDPSLRFDLLKSSEDLTYKGTGRNIFRSEPPPPPIPTPLPPDKQPAQVNTPPPPPPIDLKFYGFAGPKNGSKRVFLLKGEDIFLAKEGDIVDRRYKIKHISSNSVEVEDVLTNNTQTIPLSAG